jgi:hypothetical protein
MVERERFRTPKAAAFQIGLQQYLEGQQLQDIQS